MNVNFMRLRPLVRELRGIQNELKRANDIREAELAYGGIHIRPPVADMTGDEPETTYVNEEQDAIREIQEQLGRLERDPQSR